ncbi:MAG: hypothetical protein AAGI23_17570 [Bacteroidota bacterium]
MSSKQNYLTKAMAWVKNKAAKAPKANFEGYEAPKAFIQQSSEEEIRPDFSFIGQRGSKNYTEIAIKQDNTRKLVTRWKLFSFLANAKRGKLYLLAPRGHKAFTQDLVSKYNIKAVVRSI